jgi:hypothetical protein
MGLIFLRDRIIHVHPVSKNLRATLKQNKTKDSLLEDFNGVPHIVRTLAFSDIDREIFGECTRPQTAFRKK